jgi:hypothetical protein
MIRDNEAIGKDGSEAITGKVIDTCQGQFENPL